MQTLKFSTGNSKINKLASYLNLSKKQVVCFDLPAGHTCPMADKCKSKAHKITGKITDGDGMLYRCYAASTEAAFTLTRKLRWHNFDLLKGKSVSDMIAIIEASLTNTIKVIRIHSSGDFFNNDYFMAWVKVAENHPKITIFGYTKVLPYVNYPKSDNFHLVYSFGGKMDKKVTTEPLCKVVLNETYAKIEGLQLSCQENPSDDYDFIMAGQSFALAIHGTQPAKNKK